MKVLFVNPPVIRSDHSSAEDDFKIEGFIFNKVYCKIPGFVSIARRLGIGNGVRYGVRAGSRWPWTMDRPHGGPPYPFIMGYAASYLKSNGHEVALMDAVADDEYSYERFIKKVQAEHANIVVIECSTPTIDIDLWIAKKIAVFSSVCIAGPHLSLCAQSIKDDNPFIKYFLKGEYIKSCLEMVNTGRPGIYEPVIVEDLDSLPFPLRDYSSALNYYEPTMPTVRPQLQIYSSKGCPFKCTYCMWPQVMYNRKVTYRKPERVAEEILFCANKYGFKSILFDDDTFNVGTERVSRLCDELKKIGLPWTMMGRLDCSPLWLYDKMVDSGCVGMRFGIETFDIQVLKTIKKGLESELLRENLKYISSRYPSVMIHVTMMKALPGQTEAVHQKDMSILRELGYSPKNIHRSYQLASCVPFPGTEMYEMLSQRNPAGNLNDFLQYDGGKDTIMKTLKLPDTRK